MKVVGIGVDIESARPFREKKWPRDRNFFRRVFSDGEIRYCLKFADPAPNFAARFCAKEALVKAATPSAALLVSDMEVGHDGGKQPYYLPRSKRPEVRSFFSRHVIHLSLSHTKDYAVAFAVVHRKTGKG